MDALTKENLAGPKTAPTTLCRIHSLSKEYQVSAVRIFFSLHPHTESDGESADLGVGLWKDDPDTRLRE